MNRFLLAALLVAGMVFTVQVSSSPVASYKPAPVTFNKDVLPILQRDCQVCHRPGEIAPMSFLSYESTRPWAKAMKEAVMSKKMPPWLADPQYGYFRNAPKLTEAEANILAAWADNGAPEGDAKDKPAPLLWEDAWRIKPDVVVSMPEPFGVPAKGKGEVVTFDLPSPFTEDTWVTSIEIRPGNRSVVHHAAVQFFAPAPKLQPSQMGLPTPAFNPAPSDLQSDPNPGGGYYGERERVLGSVAVPEGIYVPGGSPMDFRPHNSAKLIRAGTDIRLEMHYTPNGAPASDQTLVGFTVAKKTPQRRFVTLAPANLVDTQSFRIPAGESNWEARGELTFAKDAQLVWLMPHMHLRGKDMTYRLIFPNGRSETVLHAKYDFGWQLGYDLDEPIRVPKGTRMEVTAHFDNSANNPRNPDPTKDVNWGGMTSDEMMVPWFGLVTDPSVDPREVIAPQTRRGGTRTGLPSGLPAGLPSAQPGSIIRGRLPGLSNCGEVFLKTRC